MNRLLILISGPTVLLGLLLFVLCLVGAWYVNRVQSGMSNILADNVSSMQAAQQLELHVRSLRFRSFLYIVEPSDELLREINSDENHFREWLGRAEAVAITQAERTTVREIREAYQSYHEELKLLREQAFKQGAQKSVRTLADVHPIRRVTDLCREYARLNEEQMVKTIEENNRVSSQLHWAMLLFGLGGPLGGILSGFGIARGLSQSIYRLSLRVQGVADQLVQDVATLRLLPQGDLYSLDRQLDHVVQRVTTVMEQVQRQQEEMLRAQQLAAVGQLAASVAHEVRNPLTAMKMLVEASLRPHKPRPMTGENLRVIHTEILRLEQTVADFLDFARPSALVRDTHDLGDIVKQAIELCAARARQQGVRIDCQFGDRPIQANVDRRQLCNVFVNLFLNALDAMPQGGTLEIRLAPSDHQTIIMVTDTGEGIVPAMTNQLFTPFVSTKPTGSGLGLNICKRIVEEHQGTIIAANRAEGGACFTVTLPSE